MSDSNDNDGTRKPIDSNQGGKTIDLNRLRLSQDFAATTGVKKVITTIPVRKPERQEFIRVHPSEDYRIETAVMELKEERETYLVDADMWHELPGEVIPKVPKVPAPVIGK